MELIQLWMLYLLALLFGVVDAFFFPAQSAIVPQMVSKENLQIGNSVIQGTAQLSRFGGPILAGLLIVLLGSGNGGAENMPGLDGIAFAFGIDAATFLVSAITLMLIQMPVGEGKAEAQRENVWLAIRSGLENIWNDLGLRNLFFLIVGINVLVNGPILVGIPVLADTRFIEGASAFGFIMSGYGGGNLLGTILAGVLPRPPGKYFSMLLLVMIGVMGIGIFLFGFVTSTTLAVIIGLVMGIANGYVSILFITWLQNRTPQAMLGRVMSLLMFAAMGLNPISMALSGFFFNLNVPDTFMAAGILMSLLVVVGALNTDVRSISFSDI
jgi:MFS family permease